MKYTDCTIVLHYIERCSRDWRSPLIENAYQNSAPGQRRLDGSTRTPGLVRYRTDSGGGHLGALSRLLYCNRNEGSRSRSKVGRGCLNSTVWQSCTCTHSTSLTKQSSLCCTVHYFRTHCLYLLLTAPGLCLMQTVLFHRQYTASVPLYSGTCPYHCIGLGLRRYTALVHPAVLHTTLRSSLATIVRLPSLHTLQLHRPSTALHYSKQRDIVHETRARV